MIINDLTNLRISCKFFRDLFVSKITWEMINTNTCYIVNKYQENVKLLSMKIIINKYGDESNIKKCFERIFDNQRYYED